MGPLWLGAGGSGVWVGQALSAAVLTGPGSPSMRFQTHVLAAEAQALPGHALLLQQQGWLGLLATSLLASHVSLGSSDVSC